MADLLDNMASESSDDEDDAVPKKRQRKISTDTEDSEVEESDNEDELAEVQKNFIVGNDDEEDNDDNSSSASDSDEVDSDDLDLIEDNVGIRLKPIRKKKTRRLRFADEDDGEEAVEKSSEQIHRQLFPENLDEDSEAEDNDGSRIERLVEEADEVPSKSVNEVDMEEDDDDEEEDEGDENIDDFIVDEHGRPISETQTKRVAIHTDSALQEAQDIFGVDFDFNDFEKFDQAGMEDDDEDEVDEYSDDGEEDAEEPGEKASSRRQRRKRKEAAVAAARASGSLYDVFEPDALQKAYFTEADDDIRATDVPERFSTLRHIPVTVAEKEELVEESEWIYKHVFMMAPISNQDIPGQKTFNEAMNEKGIETVGKIRDALEFMRLHNFEVPFIGMYRKEYVSPELNMNDLWRIFFFDEKWCQLRDRKTKLVNLMEKMAKHQFSLIDPDKSLPDHFRPLTDLDIEKARACETLEELNDVYQHFVLYYGDTLEDLRRAEVIASVRKEAAAAGADEATCEKAVTAALTKLKRRALKKTPYKLCIQAGLTSLSKRWGLSAEHFAANFRDQYQRYEVDQCQLMPDLVASEYCNAQFPDVERVLRGARFMVAQQIAAEPSVRQLVRRAFFEQARITAVATETGEEQIDEAHPLFAMKYLKGKPVNELVNDNFLRLLSAEQDKLIEMHIHMDELKEERDTSGRRILDDDDGGNGDYFNLIKDYFYRDEYSDLAQAWNEERFGALRLALRILYRDLKKELRNRLAEEARDGISRFCAAKISEAIRFAPYSNPVAGGGARNNANLSAGEVEYFEGRGVRVLAVAYNEEQDSVPYSCVLSSDGEVIDYMKLSALMRPAAARNAQDRRAMRDAELQRLRRHIISRKPHVIALGCESRDALYLQKDIERIILELHQENEDFPLLQVELVDTELSLVFAKSARGLQEFPDYPLLLREAVSLGRRLQDPLQEFAAAVNSEEDILSLRLHPLQDVLPKEHLLTAITCQLVNCVNEVGVDINRALEFSHIAPLLQFVGGLGPRKAAAMLRELRRQPDGRRITSRVDIVTKCTVGSNVFVNCAGFIKIDAGLHDADAENPDAILDGTRVHPESYDLAKKMAVDALEYDDSEDPDAHQAVAEILEAPEKLRELDLDAFAEELRKQDHGSKHITLYDIREELNDRYRDFREAYKSPNSEEKFNMVTKETPDTFYPGKLVECVVVDLTRKVPKPEDLETAHPTRDESTHCWVCPFCKGADFQEISDVWAHFDAAECRGEATGVRVRLDNGVTGFIFNKNLSDKPVNDPGSRVQKNQTILARILKIDIERFSVDLTCRSSDLKDVYERWRPPRDAFYDRAREAEALLAADARRQSKQRIHKYTKRVIAHPQFRNISYDGCLQLMRTLELGEVIIRPSSKGADHLTLSWKVDNGVVQHIDVVELGKKNEFSLGTTLRIGEQEFEDLDEIVARHVQPMAAYARDIMTYKYYVDTEGGDFLIMEKLLREERAKSGGTVRIPYLLSASAKFPGKFLLSYLPREQVHHEFITTTPDGLRYRAQIFVTLPQLIQWFKEHYREQVPRREVLSAALVQATPLVGNSPAISADELATYTPAGALSSIASSVAGTPAQNDNMGGSNRRARGRNSTLPNTPVVDPGTPGSMMSAPTPSSVGSLLAALKKARSSVKADDAMSMTSTVRNQSVDMRSVRSGDYASRTTTPRHSPWTTPTLSGYGTPTRQYESPSPVPSGNVGHSWSQQLQQQQSAVRTSGPVQQGHHGAMVTGQRRGPSKWNRSPRSYNNSRELQN